MSALPPKADMCGAIANVRFGPIADIGFLFDHLVGATNKRIGNGETERSSGLEVDAELDFRALLNWQFAGLFAFENSSHVDPCQAIAVRETAAIAHQTACRSELAVFKNRWHCVADSQRGELFLVRDEKPAAADHEPARFHLDYVHEGEFELTFAAGIE